MADDTPLTSRALSQAGSPKEDAETKATREELKQTAISEKPAAAEQEGQMAKAPKLSAVDTTKPTDDTLKEQVSSPKKKRAHDQLDENHEPSSSESAGSLSPKDGTNRTDRLEPEKKRARDELAEPEAEDESGAAATDSNKKTMESTETIKPKDPSLSASLQKPASGKDDATPSTTSAAAFAKSGFAKLSGAASPFGSLGATGGASPFGALASSGNTASGFGALSSSASSSPFGALGASSGTIPAPPKLTFGPPSEGSGSASPFASLNGGASKPFGSAFGSGFGGGLGASKLTSFAKPGGVLKDDKPARPFGAPESDNEASENGESDTETGDDGVAPEESESEEKAKDEDGEADQTKPTSAEDKKKATKLQKVVVDDGEAGEATIFLARAKVYHLDKGSEAWKERGAGILKINVPEATIDFDQTGAALTASFDASMLDAGDSDSKTPKVVRLIMRQDHTLRVVINTAVLAGTEFVRREMMKAVGFLFTALEGPDARPVTLQIKPVNKPGKRKRSQTADASAPGECKNGIDTPERPAAGKARRMAKSTSKASNAQQSDPACVQKECVIEWPDWFKVLDKTYRALNLVVTFCCTRKHLATTFDTIKSTVESHINRQLLIEDVAAIAALRPDGVRFEYVDEVMLQLDARGAERDDTFRSSRNFLTSQSRPPDSSVGGFTGREGLQNRRQGEDGDVDLTGKEVLYFEFLDGDLKREVQCKKTGEPTKPTRKLRDEELKMPVYSQKQMANLIEKRNQRFLSAVNSFINKCVAESTDPVMALKSESEKFIPVPTAATQPSPPPQTSTIPESIPKERKSIPEIVQELKESPFYTGQIVPDGHRVFKPQEPVFGDLNFLLSQDLVNALYNAKGITQFYAHQTEAINGLIEGHHVVVATSTSSGKSLIYQLPVLHALEKDHETRAMYIFPTKALAQDQKRSLKEMLAYMPGLEHMIVDTFDGDTLMTARNMIRDEARIIFTNPDMMHITILPQEERWRTFLKNLRYVVVDELHYYNGLMGSHVALIMRRLRRICAAVGNRHVKFVSCSATVANPREHFKTIFGISDVRLVDFDGSPSGRKEFLCWNTPYRVPGDPSSGRGDAKYECARLFCQLVLRGVRVIAFCRVREQCEKLVGAVKAELERLGRPECIARVMGYRGGYTPQDRRKIEAEMFEGKLVGIVATTALELGVDIGSLDCVLTWGFPYTIANLRQQSGRAGRRNLDSLSILVGDSFPTDQHYMQNPDEIFTQPNCALQVDLENMLVREGHIQCAAYEMPIRPDEDAQYFGADLPKICVERLVPDELGYYHCHDRFRPMPSKFVTIRDTEDEHFAIVDISHGRNVVLEELEASRATFTLYDGAIFLHQGTTYLVRDFDPEKHMARVEKVKVDWTTEQRDFTDIDPIETEAVKRIEGSPCRAYHGTIRIKQVVFGYFKVDKRNRVLDAVHVDNPPVVRFSKGTWLDIPRRALEILDSRRLNAAAAIHAAEHCVMSLVPNFVISMPGDVRTECKNSLKEFARKETSRKRPARLTFYDAKGGAGGSGINIKAFEHVDMLLQQAVARVEGCGCMGGCLECVASETCKQHNAVMSKAGAEVVLKSLLGLEIDVDSLPMGPEDNSPAGVETIVLAKPVPPRDVRLWKDYGSFSDDEDDGSQAGHVDGELGPTLHGSV
ncbi:hypothetical protein PspLS_02849 [Pyricularia sp. CBS 133598]|nr:hypothetical protein PspLS_02849 [Pyricularia sp. CBS 133598]